MATEHANRVYDIARVMHPNWSDLDLDPPFPLCVRGVYLPPGLCVVQHR